MHKWNLLKKTAPCILSLAVAATSFPTAVMATDLDSSIVADETEQSDEEEIAEVSDYEAAAGEVADAEEIAAEDQNADEITEESAAENTEEEASGADEFTAAEDETEAFADSDELQGEYQYVYAGLTWAEYWASEGVYAAGDTTSSEEVDGHNELDKGAFDTVTRATTNHGLHRGSFQTETTIVAEDGSRYPIAAWVDRNTIKLTDGKTVGFNRGTITKADGTTVDMHHYEVYGLKYIPVAVKTEDYDAFCQKYNVVTNDGVLEGGYGEVQLSSYTATAAVTADTNGLKYAVKNGDSFTFEARKTGADSGIKDQAQKTAANVTPTVKEASGSYGEFLRVDITGEGYGDLGANMQAVRWDYCGDDATGTKVLRSFGTKFAADNWMHKSMGIQLGLTDSLRCQLPEGTDGTGYWRLTVYALGYADYSFVVQATDANIVKPSADKADTTELTKAVEAAKALKETDYTADSWAAMQTELQEAEELLAREDATQAEVDEALNHLNAAVAALVKADAYRYVYAGLTWAEYWANEGVYAAGDTTSSEEVDGHNELDKGAFDTVTRATTNHGLHRGSFQTETTIVAEDGSRYPIAAWVDRNTIKLTDGKTVGFNRGTITKADGTTVDMHHYEVYGLKYIPVAVKTEDYDAFCQKYNVVTNDGVLEGGYGEVQLSSYTATAAVTADTNGLKYAVKNGDSFTFEARKTGADSGIKDQAQKTAANVTPTVKEASGSYGEFLRVDITGEGYGDLGANMQAVRWDYCGDDATGTKVLRSFGTKFAADNWMHKSMGIQLGLTDSLRCQLPEGTDGTGYWRLTVYALGYADYSFVVQATDANIVKPSEEPADTTALTKEVETAKALAENDYTKATWAAMQTELQEAEELLAREDATQAEVDEALEHLKAAEAALVKVTVTLDKTSATIYTGKTVTLKATSNDTAKTVTYTTSNKAVATVSSTGVVKGVKAGTAVITANCGNATATCKVTVKTSTVKFTKTSTTVYTGKTVTVKATATPSATVKYTSSNTKIATVNASTGVVKGIKAGTVTITATTSTGLKTTCKVTVKAPSVKFAKKSAVVYKGKTATVKATLAGVSSVTYKSSNTKIATVNSKTGTVKGIKAGTVTITATSGKLKATYKLTVKNPTFTLTKSSATIAKGKTTTIKSKAAPASKVTYISSNKKVATVTSKGVVKGIRKGKATITVKCNGITKKFVVTVK